MTTILPTLELKYNKETTSNSSNKNTLNNNIIIKHTTNNLDVEVPNIELPNPSSLSIKEADTPKNILVNLKKLSLLC
jgi:hypothetical protein